MVTNQTALRLKAANFPQPLFAPLQWWYSPAEELLLACSFDKIPNASRPYRFVDPANPDRPVFWANIKSFCYAPAASDILPLLPTPHSIEWRDGSFQVWPVDDSEPAYMETFHKDMDEATALLWLAHNTARP